MANYPAAEVEVTVALVRHLLTDQHPDLAGLPLTLVANGWDNVMLRLGDELAVRLPRRARAVPNAIVEHTWLPVLAPGLAIDVPVPARLGSPTAYFPWAWSVVPWFEGRSGFAVPPADRTALAIPLAGFLRGLHVPAPADAPHNPFRGVPLATRDAAVRERIASGAVPDADRLLELWRELARTPVYDGPPLWLHGDLHPGNLVIDDDGLRAIVDFGDLTAGDPASDLSTAWLTFDAAGREVFVAEVTRSRGPDRDLWRRAHAWAIAMTAMLFAASDDHPELSDVARHGLAEVLGEAAADG